MHQTAEMRQINFLNLKTNQIASVFESKIKSKLNQIDTIINAPNLKYFSIDFQIIFKSKKINTCNNCYLFLLTILFVGNGYREQ